MIAAPTPIKSTQTPDGNNWIQAGNKIRLIIQNSTSKAGTAIAFQRAHLKMEVTNSPRGKSAKLK